MRLFAEDGMVTSFDRTWRNVHRPPILGTVLYAADHAERTGVE
jgi:hypothetical protein